MTTSLKAFIPKLAKALEMNPTALYERQRALIRGGLLETKPGHGPGSGVRLSPEAVAMLLISVVATSSLVDVENQTRIVADLRAPDGELFAQALARTLGSEDLAAKCSAVQYQNLPMAILKDHEDKTLPFSHEGPNRERPWDRPMVQITILKGEIIQHIAKEIANAG